MAQKAPDLQLPLGLAAAAMEPGGAVTRSVSAVPPQVDPKLPGASFARHRPQAPGHLLLPLPSATQHVVVFFVGFSERD
ncbi:MAG TPA: hypothetical protein VME20_07305 [Acidimicrobiales bacterium]|nr:hypothetical protein [Acidimicrobiales bacterium]